MRDSHPRHIHANMGFTLIELLVVIAIIGALSSMLMVSFGRSRESAYLAKTTLELRNIHKAVETYALDYGEYPPDVGRDIPPGLEQYLSGGDWPGSGWPGSILDWDSWIDPDTSEPIYQISVRFCPIGQPSQCRFPNYDWAEDFDINSAVYYCISGTCRSHISEPIDHPGYCVNCN